MNKAYAVLAESTGLHNLAGGLGLAGASVYLFDGGDVNYSGEMWRKVKARQAETPYFASEAELVAARKRGFRGGWNMSKASVVSVFPYGGCEVEYETPRTGTCFPQTQIEIGYSLWAVDPSGQNRPMRVDYAAAAVSRAELPNFHDNPEGMYALKDGVYIKNDNDHVNALGIITLVVLGVGSSKSPEDLEALLIKRGAGIDFLSGTWTAPGGYAEPEYRTRLSSKFLENNAKAEIFQEAAIRPNEVELYPAGFSQGDVETAFAYIGFSALSPKEVFARKLGSEIERRLTVPLKEYDSCIAGLNIDPESLGALEGIFGSGKLLEKYVGPFCRLKP